MEAVRGSTRRLNALTWKIDAVQVTYYFFAHSPYYATTDPRATGRGGALFEAELSLLNQKSDEQSQSILERTLTVHFTQCPPIFFSTKRLTIGWCLAQSGGSDAAEDFRVDANLDDDVEDKDKDARPLAETDDDEEDPAPARPAKDPGVLRRLRRILLLIPARPQTD